MLKRLSGGISNTTSRKTETSSFQEKAPDVPKNDTVHIHGMWYQPTSRPRVTSRDQKFRGKLVTAYLDMVHGASDLPPNVKAHLWTDRKSMHALYMPAVKPNGGEIEIPHSMLAKAPLSVHLEGEIEELIAKVPYKELRTQLEALHNHPAGENIGLRSDLVRLLYGILYSENAEGAKDGQEAEFNIHIDIDTLAATHPEKAAIQLNQNHTKRLSGLQRAKLELQAMHKSLETMKLPAKPAPLSKEEIAALAGRPQKSWSAHVPLKKAGSTVVIPDKLRKRGYVAHNHKYVAYNDENDLLGMVPGHPNAIKVANRTYRLLKNGNFKPGLSDLGVHFFRPYIFFGNILEKKVKLFHRLNGGVNEPKSKALNQQQVVDYFRLAEKIRRMRPALQEKMNALTLIARDETRIAQERDTAKMRIEALRSIYKASCKLVESFVNKSSYYPQIAASSMKTYKDFRKLLQPILGIEPQYVTTDSWKGNPLESTEKNNYNGPQYMAQENLVFEEIKTMIRLSEAE